MSAPWLKFYPTDWRADPALRMCSLGARGLWMEMLCIMHEAVPYGTLRVNGKPVSDRQLAALAGGDVGDLLVELEEAGVFSREEDGTIFSRRMQRDAEKAARDKANGKGGGNPSLKQGVNPPVNGEDKAQKPEAIDQTSDASASGADAPNDPRRLVWTEGVETLVAISGKTRDAAKALIGKWLKSTEDDCALVLSRIRKAKLDRIGEPVSWITAALAKKADPPKARNAGVLALQQLRGMNLDDTSPQNRHLDAGDRNPSLASPGIARRVAVTGSG